MSIEKRHIYRFPPGTRTETTIASEVRNRYPKVQVAIFQMKNQINPDTSQHTNEKRNNIYAANEQQLNHLSNIVSSVATMKIAHNTKDQTAGYSQSWQNLCQQ